MSEKPQAATATPDISRDSATRPSEAGRKSGRRHAVDAAEASDRRRTWLTPFFVAGMVLLAAVGAWMVWWSAGQVAHVTLAQQRGLLAKIQQTRSPLSVTEADSLRALLKRNMPTGSADAQAAMLSRIRRIDSSLTVSEGDSLRVYIKSAMPHVYSEAMWIVMVRDLGIAALLAFLITFGVEVYTRRRMQEEVRGEVIEATFRRLIPPQIFAEVHRHVISARAIRRDWTIEMNVTRGPLRNEGECSLYLCDTYMSYSVENTSGEAYGQTIESELDMDVATSVGGVRYPRYMTVTIDGTEFSGARLTSDLLDPTGFAWKKLVTLDTTPMTVSMHIQEVIRVPGTFTWRTSMAAVDSRVVFDRANAPEIEATVVALHSDPTRLEQMYSGRSWSMRGGMLPWQGFQITTKMVPTVDQKSGSEEQTA